MTSSARPQSGGSSSLVPAGSLVSGAAAAGVTPAALGAGYVTFFIYSVALGLVAIVLAFVVAARQRDIQQRVQS